MSFRHQMYAKYLCHVNKDLSRSEREVIRSLGDHANKQTNEAWPAISRLASECNLSDRTVINALHGLERKNLIANLRKSGKRNTYLFPVPASFDEQAPLQSGDVDRPYMAMTTEEKREAALEVFHAVTGTSTESERERLFTGTVPGIDDWEQCYRIHTEIACDPTYGASPGERILNAIIKGRHPAWGEPGTMVRDLPYDKTSREPGAATPADRLEFDTEA